MLCLQPCSSNPRQQQQLAGFAHQLSEPCPGLQADASLVHQCPGLTADCTLHRWKLIRMGHWARTGERVRLDYNVRWAPPEVVAADVDQVSTTARDRAH